MDGTTISYSKLLTQFGFTLLEQAQKDHWKLTVYDPNGDSRLNCELAPSGNGETYSASCMDPPDREEKLKPTLGFVLIEYYLFH